MHLTTTNVKPSDFDSERSFNGTLGMEKYETMARNILVISQQNNSWEGFTFAQYRDRCVHVVRDEEKETLDKLAELGFLTSVDGVYTVTNPFLFSIQKTLRIRIAT